MDYVQTSLLARIEPEAETGALSAEAFEAIYSEYCRRVYGYFYCRTGHAQNAEDLTADLFLKVLSQYPRFDAAKLPFEIWLFRLARNMAVDFYRVHGRRASRTVGIDEAAEVAETATPELRLLENEQALALKKAISGLPEKQRNLVALKYVAGLKNTEIAAITGMTEGHTGVALHRALEKLRKILIKQGVELYE